MYLKRTAIFIAGGCLLVSAAVPAFAQKYPDRPLRLVVPFPPGGGNDILARTVGNRLTEVIGQQVVVDNRGGAGGALGAALVANSPADGYTMLLGSVGTLAQNAALKPNLPYNPPRDFAGVALLATSSFILAVHPGVPAKSVQELIALAKSQPGKLNYASAGTGSSLHMAAEIFTNATGTNIVHVPYKGTNPAMTDLLAGRVQIIVATMPPVLPHIHSGKLRALGVTTAKRAAAAPNVPTIAESGVKGFEVTNWQGIVTPRKTPRAIVDRMNRDLLATLALPGMAEALAKQGLEPARGTPAEFDKLIRDEIAKYTKVVKAANIVID